MFRKLSLSTLILLLALAAFNPFAYAGDSEDADGMEKTEQGDVHTHGGDIDLEQGDIEDAKNTTSTYVWSDTVTATGVVKGPKVQANQLTSNGDSTIKVYNGVDGQGNQISNVNSVQVTNAVPAGNNYLASKYYVDQLHVQSEYLYGSNHTITECFNANGTIEGAGGKILCNILGTSCPSGWTYANYNTTEAATYSSDRGYIGNGWLAGIGDTCTTPHHARLEHTSVSNGSSHDSSESCNCDGTGGDSTVYSVGCY